MTAILYKNYKTYIVLYKEVNIISEDFGAYFNTIAEIDDKLYYLGNEQPTISAAILAWQEVNGRDLSNEELKRVMRENNLTSDAV